MNYPVINLPYKKRGEGVYLEGPESKKREF